MQILRPEETYDPSTIRVVVDAPFMAHLEEMAQRGTQFAAQGKFAAIYHAHVEDVNPLTGKLETRERIVIEDFEPWYFKAKAIQCPREADAIAEANGDPKAFPSMLFRPRAGTDTPEVVVSRPSLCDSCVHRFARGVQGNCFNKQFERLPEVKDVQEGFDA